MLNSRYKRHLGLTATFIGMIAAAPAHAACEDLAGMELEGGTVTSAEVVARGAFEAPAGFGPPPGVMATPFAQLPAFCRVRATLSPVPGSAINSEIWMPLADWNGRYVGIGNGIWAGSISFAELGRTLARGYATAATDTGHSGSGLTAEWAIGHPERLVDFGHRAVHVTTQAAKRVVERFYDRAPDFSFWNSCSTGGRQGLMAAYRYPGDFDAISAMAPANPMTDLMVQSMWAGWQPHRYGVRLTPADLGLVHAAVLRQCDAQDGLADGLVSLPQSCSFDPGELQCQSADGSGDAATCLAPGKVEAVRAIYRGVTSQDGAQLLPGWPRGSEMQLAALVMGQEPFPVAMSYFRDLVYHGQAGWDWQETPYRQYLADGRSYGASILDVPGDGLGAFFAGGGKLLLSHGWNDGLIPAGNTLAFYSQLYHAIPGPAARDQLRLFMAPGMDHCSGGEGPSEFDTLGVLDEWATTGRAPDRIVATRPVQPPMGMGGQPSGPPREPMERPLCPYPQFAQYDGSGDPALASSFVCQLPEAG